MADVNQVVLIGRLTRDAEIKYTSGGFAISNFSIAVNRRRKDGDQWVEEANFFDINLFGKVAESLSKYLVKGKQVCVQGELRQDRWEQDGQARSKVVIVANNLMLLGGNATGNAGMQQSYSGGYNQSRPQQSSYQSRGPQQPQSASPQYNEYDAGQSYGGESDFPEEIPF